MKNDFIKESFWDDNGFFVVTCKQEDGYLRMRMTSWQAVVWLLRMHWLMISRRRGWTTNCVIPISGILEEGKNL